MTEGKTKTVTGECRVLGDDRNEVYRKEDMASSVKCYDEVKCDEHLALDGTRISHVGVPSDLHRAATEQQGGRGRWGGTCRQRPVPTHHWCAGAVSFAQRQHSTVFLMSSLFPQSLPLIYK